MRFCILTICRQYNVPSSTFQYSLYIFSFLCTFRLHLTIFICSFLLMYVCKSFVCCLYITNACYFSQNAFFLVLSHCVYVLLCSSFHLYIFLCTRSSNWLCTVLATCKRARKTYYFFPHGFLYSTFSTQSTKM